MVTNGLYRIHLHRPNALNSSLCTKHSQNVSYSFGLNRMKNDESIYWWGGVVSYEHHQCQRSSELNYTNRWYSMWTDRSYALLFFCSKFLLEIEDIQVKSHKIFYQYAIASSKLLNIWWMTILANINERENRILSIVSFRKENENHQKKSGYSRRKLA